MNILPGVVSKTTFLTGPGVFRLILALTVVFHHTTRYVKIGDFAVYAFFILSGYWIHKMYKEKYSLLERPFFTFIVSRWLRIYPTYLFNFLLILIIFFATNWHSLSHTTFFLNENITFWYRSFLLLTYNQLPEDLQLLRPAWSLDIELQFYIFFPVLFLIFTRIKPIVAYSIIFILSVLGNLFLSNLFKGTIGTYIPFFLVGSIVYLYDFKPSKTQVRISGILFFGLLAIYYLHPVLRADMFTNGSMLWMGVKIFKAYNVLLAFAVIPVIAYNVKQPSSATDRMLGNVSYDIYLFHWVIMYPYAYFFADTPLTQRLPYFAMFLVVSVVGGFILNKYLDERIEVLRRKWIKETKRVMVMV
jgi:peptidoglycan/LPS O-acetylase OafA/YrhL